MIQIDKDVPIPLSGKIISLMLAKMAVGDSVLLPICNASLKSSLHSQMRKLKPSKKAFITRSEGEGVRVWRIT